MLRDGSDRNRAPLPDGFADRPEETRDPVYVNRLFDLGYATARQHDASRKLMPGLEGVLCGEGRCPPRSAYGIR